MTKDYTNLNFLTSVLFIFQFCDFARVPTSFQESTFYTENFQFSKICFHTIVRSEHKKNLSFM